MPGSTGLSAQSGHVLELQDVFPALRFQALHLSPAWRLLRRHAAVQLAAQTG